MLRYGTIVSGAIQVGKVNPGQQLTRLKLPDENTAGLAGDPSPGAASTCCPARTFAPDSCDPPHFDICVGSSGLLDWPCLLLERLAPIVIGLHNRHALSYSAPRPYVIETRELVECACYIPITVVTLVLANPEYAKPGFPARHTVLVTAAVMRVVRH